MKFQHNAPPRYHIVMEAMRKLGNRITFEMKKDIRKKCDENGKKFNCLDKWREMDRIYFDKMKSGNKFKSQSSSEDDIKEPSKLRDEVTSLKEEMANMTKSMKKSKSKSKKSSKKAKDVLWGDSDSSESEPESSSEYESSDESDGSDES